MAYLKEFPSELVRPGAKWKWDTGCSNTRKLLLLLLERPLLSCTAASRVDLVICKVCHVINMLKTNENFKWTEELGVIFIGAMSALATKVKVFNWSP